MAVDQYSGQSEGKTGERAASSPSQPKKRGPGRPRSPVTEVQELERVQKVQRKIIKGQQDDCKALSGIITQAIEGGQAVEAKDVNALARATSTLHELQRKAHDFGKDGTQVKAVIVIPAPAATMAMWAQLAGDTLQGRAVDPPAPARVQVIEDDVQGEAPPPPPGESDQDQEQEHD